MRPLLCLLIALPLAAPAQAPEPSFRTTTSEVLLDFVARDKHSQIIRDLRPNEIQVFEDGIPQEIKNFEFFDGRREVPGIPLSRPASESGSETPARALATTPTVNELRDISVVSVLIASLDPRGRALTLSAMREFVKTELTPSTYVGVFSLGMAGLRTLQPYTNDGEKISAAVEKAVLNAETMNLAGIGSGGIGQAGGEIAGVFGNHLVDELADVYQESMQFLTPLSALVQAQAAIPGRKVVLLFSAGLPVGPDNVELLNSVISTANRSNVSIYADDTRGITTQSTLANSRYLLGAAAAASRDQQLARVNGGDQTVKPDSVVAAEVAEYSIHADTRGNLAELAEGTGGELLPASLDLREPLKRILEEVRTHYELTYAPTNTAIDGSFRKIEVRVSRPGVTVFSRSGYYAVPTVNGRQVYPFEIATLKAINTHPDLRQFDFKTTTLEFHPGTVRNQFAFVFQAPTRNLTVTTDDKWAKVHVCVTALIKDSKGEVVDKISKDIPYDLPLARKAEMEKGIVSFTAPFFVAPGHYTLDVASVDRNSMKASVMRSALDVEQDAGFSMSDVAVARRVDPLQGSSNPYDPLQARGAAVTPELGDAVSAGASGSLAFYAVAYPPSPADAPVNVSVEIDQDGRPVMKSRPSPVPLDATGAAPILAQLPADKLTPGSRYQAQVIFEYKGERLTRRLSFLLAGPPAGAGQ